MLVNERQIIAIHGTLRSMVQETSGQFHTAMVPEECQDRLLDWFEESGAELRLAGTVTLLHFEVIQRPRFGLGATPAIRGKLIPDADGTTVMYQITSESASSGRTTKLLTGLWLIMWLIWVVSLGSWLSDPDAAGFGPGRLILMFAVIIGMGIAFLLFRRADRLRSEPLSELIKAILDSSPDPPS